VTSDSLINVLAAILLAIPFVGLALLFLHMGGIRESPMLRRLEERFPGVATLFGVIPVNRQYERLGPKPPRPIALALEWTFRLVALLVSLALMALATYLVIGLLRP